MAVVSMFSASYCHGDVVASGTARALGYELRTTDELLSYVEQTYGFPHKKLKRAMYGPTSTFGKLTHDKEKAVAYLRAALADWLDEDGFVYHGFASLLLPKAITHALRVCLVAKLQYRLAEVRAAHDVSESKARRVLREEDLERTEWSRYLFELSPWDRSLYDATIAMHKTTIDGAVAMIEENARKPALARTRDSEHAIADFKLASRVNIAIAEKGVDVEVQSDHGKVTISINQYVLRLEHLEEELRQTALAVAGVTDVKTRVGPKYHQPNIHRDFETEIPSKILLVDDERDFVHTLSERLQSRKLNAAIAYDGDEALAIVENEEYEVVVLDLQMPGIHGIEVLRRIKEGHPNTEVIILTGHGSDREEKIAEDLGAFAYLHKPVDIDVLSRTMKAAYRKLREATQDGNPPGAVER
jgi:two-component system response regulator CpxR